MNKNYLILGLIISTDFLLSSCSNTSPLVKLNANTIQNTAIAAKQAPSISVDWQNVEALADKKYQDEPLSTYIFHILEEKDSGTASGFYADDFDVSIEEAQRRLILAGITSPLIEAIAEHLGETVAAIYYENNDSNEFAIKLTTLITVEAIPPKYIYHFKQSEFKDYSIPIYIQATSDKTQQQISALQEKAWPEILKRYPNTQTIGFSPMTNTINIAIYNETPDEAERERVEVELTELVGHPVKVEFWENRLRTLQN